MPFHASYLHVPLAVQAQEGLAISGLNIPLIVVILVLSVLAYAVVNVVEIAVIGADRIRIKHLAEEGSKGAQAVERLRYDQDRFFAAVVLLQNLFVTVAAALASVLAVEILGGIGLLFGTLITTLVVALLGDITPKIVAARATDRYALLVARPFDWLVTSVTRSGALTDSRVSVSVAATPGPANAAPTAAATIHVMSFADFKAMPPMSDGIEHA